MHCHSVKQQHTHIQQLHTDASSGPAKAQQLLASTIQRLQAAATEPLCTKPMPTASQPTSRNTSKVAYNSNLGNLSDKVASSHSNPPAPLLAEQSCSSCRPADQAATLATVSGLSFCQQSIQASMPSASFGK